MLGSTGSEKVRLISCVLLFSKNSNLYDHDTSTSQADGQTTWLGNTALRYASPCKDRVHSSDVRVMYSEKLHHIIL